MLAVSKEDLMLLSVLPRRAPAFSLPEYSLAFRSIAKTPLNEGAVKVRERRRQSQETLIFKSCTFCINATSQNESRAEVWKHMLEKNQTTGKEQRVGLQEPRKEMKDFFFRPIGMVMRTTEYQQELRNNNRDTLVKRKKRTLEISTSLLRSNDTATKNRKLF